MKSINTLPIEDFINAARIATKSNKQSLTLSIKEAQALSDSLAIVMTRLAGIMDEALSQTTDTGPIQIKMDGGAF
jgi:lysyl-tRNA synthetase class II